MATGLAVRGAGLGMVQSSDIGASARTGGRSSKVVGVFDRLARGVDCEVGAGKIGAFSSIRFRSAMA